MHIVIQRQVRPSLNQVTKRVETLQTQYTDKVAAIPVVTQRQVPRPVRRDSCECARDHADHDVRGTTGPSVSDCAEDRESPAGAARERMHEQIVDVPLLNERISERMHAQIADVPVIQK